MCAYRFSPPTHCERERAPMPEAALEIVGAKQKLEALPLHQTQRVSRASAATRLALLVPAILLVLVPVSFVLVSTDAFAQAIARPADAFLAGAGVAAFIALFGLPLSRAVAALVSRRTVRIDAGYITVGDHGLLGSRTWTLPLASYGGLAHVVRTSLSGARHELVLVHADRSRRVLLCASDKLSQADVECASRLLDLPLVPPNDLYRWRSDRAEAPVHTPVQQAA